MRATVLRVGACLVWLALQLPAPARGQTDGGGRDAAVFQVLVTELARSAEGELLVDPRVLAPGADLLSVDQGEVGAVSPDRAHLLDEMRIQRTEFLSDLPCLFAAGSPPPPEHAAASGELTAMRRRCRARPAFTSAILGPARTAETADGAEAIAITVVRMTTSSYSVTDYVLRECPAGRWRVVSTEKRVSVQS